MSTVLVFGSFDLLHPGHLHFLRQAKVKGDRLVVVLARDQTISEVKGRHPRYSEQERVNHLHASRIPDEVLLGHHGDKYLIIEEVRPDIICLGYDQHVFADKLSEELKKRDLDIEVVRLSPHKEHIFKSSKLKSDTSLDDDRASMS